MFPHENSLKTKENKVVEPMQSPYPCNHVLFAQEPIEKVSTGKIREYS